jgi:nucleotide-binding universal stress UspA family protein
MLLPPILILLVTLQGLNAVAVTPLLVQGATIKTILQEAIKLKSDMIVIGSHGHGALYKTLVGSVSEGVIRQASCPVVVIPAQIKS